MTSLFVSHSRYDRALVERVRERVQARGYTALFIDFDPSQGIPAGRNWERELYSQLRKTDAVIFLASAASVGSNWCFAEIALARSLGKPVFPLRVEAGARLPLLGDVQEVDLADEEQAFTRLWAGLQRAGLEARDAFAWDPRRSPYPGLGAFSFEDAAVFFGRSDKIDELLQRLHPILPRGGSRFLAIVGPSGSGKSSLLHAGLLPRLDRLRDRWLLLPPLVPGHRPTRSLARSLVQAFAVQGERRSVPEVEGRLLGGSRALVSLAVELTTAREGSPNVLVVVDQAEELLTITGSDEQQAFLRLLHGALGDDGPLWAVATMRSEFLSRTPERAGLTEGSNAVVVEPLSRSRLPEVIQQPARRAGIEFEPGLVERLVEDTTGGDALPLLAYTLRELYQRVGPEGTIRHADYEAMGGVSGALRRRADSLVEELGHRGQRELVVPTLLKLATVDREGEPISRRLRRSTLDRDEQSVVQAFVDAHLLISRKAPGEDVTVEVAHEALLRLWPPLREAIEASRHFLRMRSELEALAADWDRDGREESYLLRGARLATFGEWADQHAAELTPLERQFLAASRTAAQRSYRRLRRLLVGLGIVSVVAVVLAGLAVLSRREVRREARVALSRQLAAQATYLIDSQPDLALLLGLESLRVAPSGFDQDALDALALGLARDHHVSTRLSAPATVGAVAFSPDGRILATAGGDAAVRLWDVASGQPRGLPFRGHTARVRALAFSPDGQMLASAGDDDFVRLWDVSSARPKGPALRNRTGGINDVAFSPDGAILAAGGGNATVRLWNPATGRPQGPAIRSPTDWVNAVAFSPDGSTLVSTGSDDLARLWDVRSRKPRGVPLRGHTAGIYDVAFSADGRVLASGSEDRTVRLWDMASGRPMGPALRGHTAWVRTVALSPDGKTVASAADDATVRLWDVASGRARGPALRGHTAGINDVAFSPDGRLLATGSGDTTVRLWEVPETRILGQPLRGHAAGVGHLAISPDGRTLASAGDDATIRLWDVAPGARSRSRVLRGHEGETVDVVAFSPDGRTLASAGDDATVRLWDVASGRPRGAPLRGHSDLVWSVAFSPDGRTLASAGGDSVVRLWDVASGQAGRTLHGHENSVNSVAFSPDGKSLASGSEDGTVRLWDVTSGRPRGQPLRGHDAGPWVVAFGPDGKTVASGGGDTAVRLWDVATARARGQPLRGHVVAVYDVAFSPDGRTLASTGGDGTVRLWDVATGQPRAEPLRGHTGVVNDVAFNPESTTLASAGDDATVRLWDVATGQPRGQPLRGHGDSVFVVAFGPDGKVLASGSEDGTVRLWDLRVASWVDGACRIAHRNLTSTEWNRFIGPASSYRTTCKGFPATSG